MKVFPKNLFILPLIRGTQWRSCLRHCAESQKVAVSISGGVVGILHWHNPLGRTTALRSTQSLREMSTRNISLGVKEASAWYRQPYHLHLPIVLISGSLNLLEHLGPVQVCAGIALLIIYKKSFSPRRHVFCFVDKTEGLRKTHTFRKLRRLLIFENKFQEEQINKYLERGRRTLQKPNKGQ